MQPGSHFDQMIDAHSMDTFMTLNLPTSRTRHHDSSTRLVIPATLTLAREVTSVCVAMWTATAQVRRVYFKHLSPSGPGIGFLIKVCFHASKIEMIVTNRKMDD